MRKPSSAVAAKWGFECGATPRVAVPRRAKAVVCVVGACQPSRIQVAGSRHRRLEAATTKKSHSRSVVPQWNTLFRFSNSHVQWLDPEFLIGIVVQIRPARRPAIVAWQTRDEFQIDRPFRAGRQIA